MTDCQNCKRFQAQAEVLNKSILYGPHITKSIRRALERLDRRANYLEARAAIRESKGEPASLDDAEAAALRWAVHTIKMLAAAGKVDDATVPDLDAVAIQSRLDAAEAIGGSK